MALLFYCSMLFVSVASQHHTKGTGGMEPAFKRVLTDTNEKIERQINEYIYLNLQMALCSGQPPLYTAASPAPTERREKNEG